MSDSILFKQLIQDSYNSEEESFIYKLIRLAEERYNTLVPEIDNDGETEQIDFENYYIDFISDNLIIIVAGGDWQEPTRFKAFFNDGILNYEIIELNTNYNDEDNNDLNLIEDFLGIQNSEEIEFHQEVPQEEQEPRFLQLQNYLKENIPTLTTQMNSFNTDDLNHWDRKFRLEILNHIHIKYFERKLSSPPLVILKEIEGYLHDEHITHAKFKVDVIEDETDQRSNSKFEICSFLLENFFRKEEEVKKNKLTLSEILTELEKPTEKSIDNIIQQSDFDKLTMEQKIDSLFEKCGRIAIEKEGEDSLIKTYLEIYNPQTSKLDKQNLLFNLLIVNRMLEFTIMDWVFDDKDDKFSESEINLKHEWWDKYFNMDISDQETYVTICEKEFRLKFYTNMFKKMAENSDRKRFNQRDVNFKKLIHDDDSRVMGDYLKEYILNSTEDKSVLIITPDLESFIPITEPVSEELGNKGQIKYLGKWYNRIIYSVDTEQITVLKNFTKGLFYINSGNRFIVNPDRPMAYINVIENPFLDKPILRISSTGKFDFHMNNSKIVYIDGDLD